jgi:dihydrolipoamide dehydrogenase
MVDVIVIGGGPAGVTAALRARELGASVVLVERQRLGGTCTNDGCVPTRALAKAARLIRDAEQFGQYALVGERPQVDFPRLLERAQAIVNQVHNKKQLHDHLKQSGVMLRTQTGSAYFMDEHTLMLSNGESLHGEKFIIAAGGHARRFTFPGSEYTITHSDVWSLTALPRSVAIVGGSATGCQLATILDTFGARVHVLEVSPTILGREDPLIAQTMTEAFAQREIEIISGIGGVERVEKRDDGLRLWYTRDEQPHSLDVEAVIMAVGWVGNVESLNLPAANVRTDRSYIVVDDYLRTSTPHIFAAGDITGRMMLVQSGSYEGRIAAENAVLGPALPYKHLIVPHGGFTDPEYGSVGLTEPQARAGHQVVVAVVPYADMDRAVIDGHPDGYCKLIVSQDNHRILGAHVVGEQAVEIIQLVAAGMAADMWVEHLAELEIAYPTYAAIVGLAARQIVRQLGVMPLAPQWRSLGRIHLSEWERSGL